MARADGVDSGKKNTVLIIANQRYVFDTTYAARLCFEYSVTSGGTTYADWYLPSKHELNLLYLQKGVVGGFAGSYYWSSTEDSTNNAWSQDFNSGSQSINGKANGFGVRSIRAF
jgi:hypothetical protein